MSMTEEFPQQYRNYGEACGPRYHSREGSASSILNATTFGIPYNNPSATPSNMHAYGSVSWPSSHTVSPSIWSQSHQGRAQWPCSNSQERSTPSYYGNYGGYMPRAYSSQVYAAQQPMMQQQSVQPQLMNQQQIQHQQIQQQQQQQQQIQRQQVPQQPQMSQQQMQQQQMQQQQMQHQQIQHQQIQQQQIQQQQIQHHQIQHQMHQQHQMQQHQAQQSVDQQLMLVPQIQPQVQPIQQTAAVQPQIQAPLQHQAPAPFMAPYIQGAPINQNVPQMQVLQFPIRAPLQPYQDITPPDAASAAATEYDINNFSKFFVTVAAGIVMEELTSTETADLEQFVSSVLCATRLPKSTVLMSFVFLGRYHKLRTVRKEGLKIQIICSMVLANKMNDDNTFTNASWGLVTNMSPQQITKHEVIWLNALEWRLNLDENGTAEWNYWNKCWAQYEQNVSGACMHSPVSLQGVWSPGGFVYEPFSVAVC